MKKLMLFAVTVAFSTALMAGTYFYDVKMTAKIPITGGGEKTIKSETLSGYLAVVYDTDGVVQDGTLVIVDKKRNTVRVGDTKNVIFGVIGKKFNKTTVLFDVPMLGDDMSLTCSGSGTVKKHKLDGCGPCGDDLECSMLSTADGTLTGTYDCFCAEFSPQWALNECVGLGLILGDIDMVQPVGAVYGTWAIKYNKSITQAKFDALAGITE